MPGARPRLQLVAGGARSGAPAPAPAPRRPGSAALVPWGLAGLLALSLLANALLARRAERLEARVAGLEGELAAARAALGRPPDPARGAASPHREPPLRDPAPAGAPPAVGR